MPVVSGETSHSTYNTVLYALSCFYSRIILRKLNNNEIKIHRKVEKSLKKFLFAKKAEFSL